MAETILVTGANRGIGLELTRCFATDGWRVFACCREPEKAEELGELVREFEDRIQVFTLDVTDLEQIHALSEVLAEESIDILFNNAGISGPKGVQGFGDVPVDVWLEVFHVNTIAPLKMAEAFVEQVARSDRRVIATMGSLLGSIADNGSGGLYCYRTSKTAVNMVMKNLSIDLAGQGIVSMVFHPGWVRTDMGGEKAPTLPSESATGIYRVLSGAGPSDNGRFLTFEGEDLPW